MNYFQKLKEIDVSEHVEKKGKFSYLSWPFAYSTVGVHHPDAQFNVKRFPMMGKGGVVMAGDTPVMVPYMETNHGVFVEVEVVIEGVSRSQIHPVLNHQNKPIASPSTFEINTSIQRATVKALALHGLGLYIYAGEDLPVVDVTVNEVDTASRINELEATVTTMKTAAALGTWYSALSSADKALIKNTVATRGKDLKNLEALTDDLPDAPGTQQDS